MHWGMGPAVQQDNLPCPCHKNQEFKTVRVWNSHLVSILWPDFYTRLETDPNPVSIHPGFCFEISVNQDIATLKGICAPDRTLGIVGIRNRTALLGSLCRRALDCLCQVAVA